MSPVSRPYSHPADLNAMIDFLQSVRPPAWISEYPGVVDLQESMGRPSIQERTRLWIGENGDLVAFAFVLEPYNNLVFEIALNAGRNVEDDLISWAFKSADRSMGTLDTSCRDDDLARITLLERYSFIRMDDSTLHMVRDLKETLPLEKLPEGFTIRSIIGESEVDAIVALHQAAFGTSNMTREERLVIMHAPDYDPSLDLIVIAPDGRMAGYCTCSISTVENKLSGVKAGHTDPVAVHPDFQGRGLARALLLTGARLLKERGMDLARLGTSSDNFAMQKAAESAGFQVYSKRIWFSKEITHA